MPQYYSSGHLTWLERAMAQKMPLNGFSVLLVTEAYNISEGQSEAAFVRAVNEIEKIAHRFKGVTVGVLDPTDDGVAAALLQRNHPLVKVWHLPAQSYEGQKIFAAQNSDTDIVVYLDGDCRPLRENWFEKILAPFADETVCAVGGVTHYDDFSITGIAMSILDFGFLYGAKGSSIGCYASNNVAFRSDTLKAVPFPVDERMRCLCYKHGQLLERAHRRVYLAPEAVVLHELPNIEKERHRRGYDHVAALWVDPQLPETAFLAEPQTAASHLLQLNYNAVMKRLKITPPDLGLTTEKVELVTAKIAELIDIDLCGIKVALAEGETNGFNQKAYEEHCILNKRQ